MNHTWKLGPQRVRDPSKVAVELLANDMGGSRPLLARYQDFGSESWDLIQLRSDGRSYSDKDSPWDLMPPLMTRKEVAQECLLHLDDPIVERAVLKILDCYDMLRREGRVEE